jgi:hypothetical protein
MEIKAEDNNYYNEHLREDIQTQIIELLLEQLYKHKSKGDIDHLTTPNHKIASSPTYYLCAKDVTLFWYPG